MPLRRGGGAAVNRRDAIDDCLRRLVPAAPDYDRDEIRDHALHSPGLKTAAPDKAAWLSLVAHVRHVYTDYDELLADGYDVDSARHFCLDQINEVLTDWGCKRQVTGEEE